MFGFSVQRHPRHGSCIDLIDDQSSHTKCCSSVSSFFQILRICAEDARFRDIRIALVSTDGDSVRRGMLKDMTTDAALPVAESLAGLELMHLLQSKGGFVQSMDPKHNLKRWRTRLYSDKGVLIAAGRLSLNKSTLWRLFSMRFPNRDFSQYFNATDK